MLLRVLFFMSGAAGLMYEVVWARLLADALGSTALSTTVVFSVFLAALALGAMVFGQRVEAHPAPLRLYGWLEVGVGLLAALATATLIWASSGISVLSPGPGRFGASLVYAFAVCAVFVGPPTLLMGGTLPAVLAATRRDRLPRDEVARLYGWNTLGAAAGTSTAGFFLIWWAGLSTTVGVAVTLNLAVGIVALFAARSAAGVRGGGTARPDGSESDTEPEASVDPGSDILWTGLALFSGFSVLGFEVLWGRLARFLLGDRTLAITALLAAFIMGLGLASVLAQRWASKRRDAGKSPLEAIGGALTLSSPIHLVSIILAHRTIQGGGLAAIPLLQSPVLGRIAIVCILILPPVLALGVVFPLLATGARSLDQRPGPVIGKLYFFNTLGAVAGAIFASILLSRATGTFLGFLVLILATTVVGLWAWTKGGPTRTRAPVALVGGTLLLLPLAPRALLDVREGETLLASVEDEYGVQTMVETDFGTLRVRNNRLSLIFDLGHPQTAHAQQMAAHLTTLLAAEVGDVLNVGTGYGITAGAYTLYPDVESVQTIEILPFLVDHQRSFEPHNFGYLDDQRVTLSQGDGRHHLAASRNHYDIISVNVLDPYLPGSSSLYTIDFWELARSRLRPGGVFTQLFWGEDLGLLVKGLESVFPTVLYFPAYGGTSYNVIAFGSELPEAPRLHLDRIGPAAFRAMEEVTGSSPETELPTLVADAWAGRERITRLGQRTTGPLHTDDHPVLEYRWAHGVTGVSALDSPLIQN